VTTELQIAENWPLSVVDAKRLYIIGDIHGRADLLDQMIGHIGNDIGRSDTAECLTVTLGDYIDRGPNSKDVLERLSNNPFPTKYIALRGNHEAMFEQFLFEPTAGFPWLQMGGLKTLHSYGVTIEELMNNNGLEAASRAMNAALPEKHRQFLSLLQPFLAVGQNYFCHAGIRPQVPMAQQKLEDLLWIREEFLNCDVMFEKTISHGHTPCEWPDVRPNRINVDTGAYATGRLTCLVLDGEERRFIYTG
jgi:serine/threonine protein phosphatase 1